MIAATGTVRPVVTTNLSTQVSGQVSEVLADFNDQVSAGQLLARLSSETFAARVRQAEAELDVARAELLGREAAVARAQAVQQQKEWRRRVAESEAASAKARQEDAVLTLDRRETLAGRGGTSDSDRQQAATEVAVTQAQRAAAEGLLAVQDAEIAAAAAEVTAAQSLVALGQAAVKQRAAALDVASVELRRTEIRAPIDGVVIRRDVEAGQTVAASLQAPTLFTLAEDLSRMRVETHVDEADIGRLRAGQAAHFTVDAFPGRRFEGTVSAIHKAPNLLQNVVTYTVLVDADNPDLVLLPGMTAVVRILVAEAHQAVRIPNAALRFAPREEPAEDAASARDESGALRVWRLDAGGRLSPLYLLTGASDEQFTVMLRGEVQPGDRLAVGYAAREGEGRSER